MTMLASQITSLTVVYSIVYSGVNQRKHQSSASLAFVREIHRGPVNFPHKWPVTRKMFPFDDVIMRVHISWGCTLHMCSTYCISHALWYGMRCMSFYIPMVCLCFDSFLCNNNSWWIRASPGLETPVATVGTSWEPAVDTCTSHVAITTADLGCIWCDSTLVARQLDMVDKAGVGEKY